MLVKLAVLDALEQSGGPVEYDPLSSPTRDRGSRIGNPLKSYFFPCTELHS